MLPKKHQQQRAIHETRLLRAVVVLAAFFLQVLVFESVGRCAEPTSVQPRRMFVPGLHPERWPAGDWVPIRPQKLESLIQSASAPTSKSKHFLFASAVYQATFNSQTVQLEQGKATLLRTRNEVGVLPFEPCNLALSDSDWRDAESESGAILGTDIDGAKWLVCPEAARELGFNWSLHGQQRLTGCDFEIDIPKAVVSTLRLSLPAGWQMKSDAGVVQQEVESDGPGITTQSSSSSASTSVWRVELGQSNRCKIRIQKTLAETTALRGVTSYRQNSRFQLRAETIEQFFDLTFDSLSPSDDELTVLIPPDLIVLSIEDEAGKDFSWQDTGAKPDKWHAIRVQLAGTGGRGSTKIAIRGRQTVSLPDSGNARLKIELPRPANAVLLGGNSSPTSVVIESPSQLTTYSTDGLRQTSTSVDEDRHELGFEQFSSKAFLDLKIQNAGRQSGRKLSVREYSLLNVGATPQELDVLLELTAQARGVFESVWRVPSGWEVTAVSPVTLSGTSDLSAGNLTWSVSRKAGKYQRLTLDLADGLPVRKPIRIRIIGQRADRSRETDFPVPVLLPEVARSVSLAFGVVGCEEPQGLRISSASFRKQPAIALSGESDWSELISVFGDIPQAVWAAEYWTQNAEVRSAILKLPDSSFDSFASEPSTTSDKNSATDDQPNEDAPAATSSAVELAENVAKEGNSAPQTDNESVPRLSIVSAEFDSQLSPSSVSRDLHRFTWRFHYAAESSPFRFRLPARAELLAVTWRGQKIAPVQEESEWFIPLAFVNAGDELSVEYTLPSQGVYLRETYRCRIPTTDATVVQFDWRVQLRNRYSVVSFTSELTPDEEPRTGNWLSWCFGPLARSEMTKVFSPFGVDSWKRLFRGRSTEVRVRPESTGNDWRTFSASAAGMPDSIAVHVCDHSRLHSLSWFVLTLSSLIGVLLRALATPHRSRFALVWLSGCVASVALVPGAYAELVGAAALGSILATLVPRSFVRPEKAKPADAVQVSMASTITRRVVTGMVLLLTVCLSAVTVAQTNSAEAGSVLDVLVPYRKSPFEAETDLDFVYIRNSDYRKLSEASSHGEDKTPELLLTEGHWSVNVTESGRAEIVASIRAALHDHSTNEIEIPIPARFLAGRAECSVNGRSVSVLPSADGTRLRVPLPGVLEEAIEVSPGGVPVPPPVSQPVDWWTEHQIELSLRPMMYRSLEESGMSLPIPGIPKSQLELSFHQPPEAVFVGKSSNAIRLATRGLSEFAFGPQNELAISWRNTAGGDSTFTPKATVQPTVALASSVDIHPNWIEHRTRAKYLVDGQEIRQVAWRLPEHCQVDLEQFRLPNPVDKALRREDGHTILICEFDPPLNKSFDFDFRWLQIQTESTGNPAIDWAVPIVPENASESLSLNSHVAGLTPEAGFQLSEEVRSLAATSDVSGDELVRFWPETDRPRIPQIAIRVSDGESVNAMLEPSQPRRTTRVSQVANIQKDGIQWTISAEVDTAVVPAFSHEFLLNSAFRVDSVNVLEDDVDRLSHWEHDKGKLTLHLRDRRSGVQNITIVGQQKIESASKLTVPRLESAIGETVDTTLLVYRAGELQVSVTGAESIDEEPVAASTLLDSGKFVGRFRLNPSLESSLEIEQAAVESSVLVIADVTSDEAGECYVSATIQLETVTRKSLKIDLPDWAVKGGLTVTPTQTGVVVNVANDQSSINVDLPEVTPQRVEIGITVRFRPEAVNTIPLPPPVVSGIAEQRSIVSLSQGMNDWELTPDDLPSDVETGDSSVPEPGLEHDASQFLAWTNATTLSRVSSASGAEKLPTMVLHSIRPGMRHSGVAKTNILLQSDEELISIDWPKNLRLISAQIDGQVVNTPSSSNGVLKLPLAASHAVHDVEILWSMERDVTAMKVQRRTMPIPRLIGVEDVRSFVLATPSRRISIIPTTSHQKSDGGDALQLSNRWFESSQRRYADSTTAEMSRLMSESLSLIDELPDEKDQDLLSQAAFDLMRSSNGDQRSEHVGSIVVNNSNGTRLEFWVVDNRVNRILVSILIAMMSVPAFFFLLTLETGDRIAKRSEVCWVVLGLIWWLCLKGSGAGFILGVVAGVWTGISYLYRRRLATVLTHTS